MYKLFFELTNENAKQPRRATDGSAGYDLSSCEEVIIPKGERKLVNTGVKINLNHDETYARIAPRSGLAVKGIDVGAGVCDCDYTGLYKVLLINNSKDDFKVSIGDRIAQLIIERINHPIWEKVDTLEKTQRGEGGFGSTGQN